MRPLSRSFGRRFDCGRTTPKRATISSWRSSSKRRAGDESISELRNQTIAPRIPLVDGIVHAKAGGHFRLRPERAHVRRLLSAFKDFFQAPGDHLLFAPLHHPGDDGHAEWSAQGDNARLAILKRFET